MKFAYRTIKVPGAGAQRQAVRCTEALNLGLPLADAVADAERMGDNA